MKFGKDGDGNYGYYGADGSLIPFKGGDLLVFDGRVTLEFYSKCIIFKTSKTR